MVEEKKDFLTTKELKNHVLLEKLKLNFLQLQSNGIYTSLL